MSGLRVEILDTLGGESWNGISVNGDEFTQWMATEKFFRLWEARREEVKEAGFKLYKHKERGWVVTIFGEIMGKYLGYEEYLAVIVRDKVLGMLDYCESKTAEDVVRKDIETFRQRVSDVDVRDSWAAAKLQGLQKELEGYVEQYATYPYSFWVGMCTCTMNV